MTSKCQALVNKSTLREDWELFQVASGWWWSTSCRLEHGREILRPEVASEPSGLGGWRGRDAGWGSQLSEQSKVCVLAHRGKEAEEIWFTEKDGQFESQLEQSPDCLLQSALIHSSASQQRLGGLLPFQADIDRDRWNWVWEPHVPCSEGQLQPEDSLAEQHARLDR